MLARLFHHFLALPRLLSLTVVTSSLLVGGLFVNNVLAIDSKKSQSNNNDLKLVHVAGPAYAIVGPLGDRTPENLGNNATFGFVVTKQGIVLIDTGATHQGAQKLLQVIRQVSDKPIIYVINTGGQDHRWLGNDYFKQHGAKIIASAAAVKDQKFRLNEILSRLANTAGEKAIKGTHDSYADMTFENEYEFSLGEIVFHIGHTTGAHSPGDSYVWLPQFDTVYGGDIICTERMLSVMSFSNSRDWLNAYQAVAKLNAKHVVPGHGMPTHMTVANRDTLNYLKTLRKKVGAFMAAGGDIADVSKIDQSRFQYLANYSALKGRNVQKVFQEMEFE